MADQSIYLLRRGPISLLVKKKSINTPLLLILVILFFCLCHLRSGSLALSWHDIWNSITHYGQSSLADRVLWRLRLPRTITAVFVGMSLGMAGAVFQSLSRNPLGSPDILGFTTGASTGAIIQIIVYNGGPWQTAIAAILFGSITAFMVSLLSLSGGVLNMRRFVFIGIGFGALLTGVNTILLVKGDLDQAANAQLWLMGSLNARTIQHALIVCLCFVVFAPLVMIERRHLILLEMGDDWAVELGVVKTRTQIVAVGSALGLTAAATAVAGPIAFIALASPQLARRLLKVNHACLGVSALIGGLLLVVADFVSQNFPFSVKVPIGLLTGFLGGLYLIWLLKSQQRR